MTMLNIAPAAGAAPPWHTIVWSRSTESENLAVLDLQRYLAQVTGTLPKIQSLTAWRSSPDPALLVGSPASNEFVKSLSLENELTSAGKEGYVLARRTVQGQPVVIVAGATPAGVVNAVYGLLRELNYGFYLGSEAIPASLPDSLASETIVRSPVLRVRGVLPWYNFFNSPTTWESEDHRALVDQLIRSGANFVGFHSYDVEPFAAYKDEDGRTTMGERLLNTSSPTWGTRAVPTKEFAGGTEKLFDQPYFGANSTLTSSTREVAILREKEILRDALHYANRRGLQTCLGFEVSLDPTDPAESNAFAGRLRELLEFYPMLDYVWLWQPETQGVQGYGDYRQHILPGKLAPNSKLPELGRNRTEVFKRVVERTAGERPFLQETTAGKSARAMEGARLEQYALHALSIMKSHANPRTRLVISGWGGDERLLSAEYYHGLDKLLPKSVVFASLDHIAPRTRIDRIYHELPPDRERWPIPWLENDGDEWHPQPYVHTYEGLMRDLLQSGSQGVLGIHWRTRDLEENFGYLMAAAWNPGLTAREYFQDLARRCYSSQIAADMAEIHVQLDALGYRWVGGAGQVECGNFGWGPGIDEKAAQLHNIRKLCTELLPRAGNGSARLQWLIDCMNWSLSYRNAELAATRAGELLTRAAAESTQSRELAADALAVLSSNTLENALQAYARRLSTRGEYGVLATINCKAMPAWRDLVTRAQELAAHEDVSSSSSTWTVDPKIVVPRFHSTAFAGEPLVIKSLVLGDRPAFAHVRQLGQQTWSSRPLTKSTGQVYRFEIPATSVRSPGLQIGFSFSEDHAEAMSWGPIAITVLPRK
ncbi:MAG: alpha-glucuronidase family glycosyl hydrolase [Candidatus Sumerlaeaceae bacterium]